MTGTERKVFQKYYPPDFDPSKLPRVKGGRPKQFVQRIMAPYNMTCNTCGEYIYQGKKFNMRRETAWGETYLGLRIYRFYFRCPNCLAEITFKTDLENCDYAQEHGATRLFEARKIYQEELKKEQAKAEEESRDAMKQLEKRTKMSRAEMEALSQLEDIREQNRAMASLDFAKMLDEYNEAAKADLKRQEEEDEKFVRTCFDKKKGIVTTSSASGAAGAILNADEDIKPFGPIIQRINDNSSSDEEGAGGGGGDDELDDDPSGLIAKLMGVKKKKLPTEAAPSTSTVPTSSAAGSSVLPEFAVPKHKRPSTQKALLSGIVKPKKTKEQTKPADDKSKANPLGALASYGSDSD